LYKRLEIPAKKAVPAIAVSVTYSKQEKAANTGSTPVSATNPFRIIRLQNEFTRSAAAALGQGAIPDPIRAVLKTRPAGVREEHAQARGG